MVFSHLGLSFYLPFFRIFHFFRMIIVSRSYALLADQSTTDRSIKAVTMLSTPPTGCLQVCGLLLRIGVLQCPRSACQGAETPSLMALHLDAFGTTICPNSHPP